MYVRSNSSSFAEEKKRERLTLEPISKYRIRILIRGKINYRVNNMLIIQLLNIDLFDPL